MAKNNYIGYSEAILKAQNSLKKGKGNKVVSNDALKKKVQQEVQSKPEVQTFLKESQKEENWKKTVDDATAAYKEALEVSRRQHEAAAIRANQRKRAQARATAQRNEQLRQAEKKLQETFEMSRQASARANYEKQNGIVRTSKATPVTSRTGASGTTTVVKGKLNITADNVAIPDQDKYNWLKADEGQAVRNRQNSVLKANQAKTDRKSVV